VPLQQTSGTAHGVEHVAPTVHTPAMQLSLGAHSFPHAPQLLVSVVMSTHP
jgi:hypothetical protein